MLYDRLGDQRKAQSHFERSSALSPDETDIRNNYAVYLCQKGKYARGEKFALEAADNRLYKTPEIAFFFSSKRRHTRSVSAFLLNRSSDLAFLLNRSSD